MPFTASSDESLLHGNSPSIFNSWKPSWAGRLLITTSLDAPYNFVQLLIQKLKINKHLLKVKPVRKGYEEKKLDQSQPESVYFSINQIYSAQHFQISWSPSNPKWCSTHSLIENMHRVQKLLWISKTNLNKQLIKHSRVCLSLTATRQGWDGFGCVSGDMMIV